MRRARKMKRPAIVINRRRHLGYSFDMRESLDVRELRVERGAVMHTNGHSLFAEVIDIAGEIRAGT